MTFRERLAKEHPDKIGKYNWGGCVGCPGSYWREYNLLEAGYCIGGPSVENCTACWDQEIPETNKIIKENDEMATPVIKPASEAIRETKERIDDLLDEVKRLKEYQKCEENARKVKMTYDAYLAVGFDERQAWKLTCMMVDGAVKQAVK